MQQSLKQGAASTGSGEQEAGAMSHGLDVHALRDGQRLTYAGRPASASPAVGYYDKHYAQQKDLLTAALGDAPKSKTKKAS